MTREEISVLSSARREAVRRQLEEIEAYKNNPFLYILNPRVKVRQSGNTFWWWVTEFTITENSCSKAICSISWNHVSLEFNFKIYVHSALMWFHFLPLAWNVKSVKAIFPSFCDFEGKSLSISACFHVKSLKLHVLGRNGNFWS